MKSTDIQYYNFITDKTYNIYLNTGSFDPKDFSYGYFIICGVEYKFHNENFIEAVNSVRVWEALKND